jgi:superoxide dismutase, Fe-Mn family
LLNSTLLHELYFASLGGDGRTPTETMVRALTGDFGSLHRWRTEFELLAEALGGDAGWVLLSYVPRDRRLINHSATDHRQSIAGGIPILALDMYAHAYHIEFGANPTAYIAAFMRNIDWEAVEARYRDAVAVAPPRALEQPEFAEVPSVTPEDLQAMLNSGEKVQIIDTRPRHYSTRSDEIVEGAVWRDPERIEEWMGTLSKEEPVVTFCVYGFHIGCQSAAALRKAGFDARYMVGGPYAWKAIKAPVTRFPLTRSAPGPSTNASRSE